MSTSGSTIGTSPAAITCAASSNCWSTVALIPVGLACLTSERSFVPKMRLEPAFLSSAAELRNWFHQLNAILFGCQALIDFQKWHDLLLVPEIIRSWLPQDFPIHCILKQDRTENPVAIEAGAGDDTRTHLMHEPHTSRLHWTRHRVDAVSSQRTGRAAATLVQRRNKTKAGS